MSGGPGTGPWTPEILDRLAALRRLDPPMHFRKIAETLNAEFGLSLTKNACIGRERRLSHPPPPRVVKMPTKKPDAPIEAPVKRRRNGMALDIYQLRYSDCRWPVTGGRPPFLYCGHTALEGRPYCEEHSRRAYNRWP